MAKHNFLVIYARNGNAKSYHKYELFCTSTVLEAAKDLDASHKAEDIIAVIDLEVDILHDGIHVIMAAMRDILIRDGYMPPP